MTDRREGGNALILAGFALAHVLLLTVVYPTVFQIPFSAVRLFFDFASNVVAGKLPYRDFPLEYPPFALVFFVLPRLAASTIRGYYFWYQAEVVVFDLIALVAIDAIARRRQISAWPLLAAYTLAVVAVGPIIGQQFDIFPATLTLLAVCCFWREKHVGGWILLALGTLTKLYPLLTAPIWLLAYVGSRPTKYAARAAAAFAATTFVVLTPWLFVAPTSLMRFFEYHARRGIQIESSYGAGILLFDKLGLTIAGTGLSYGSWNVTGEAADVLTPLSTVVFLLAMCGAYLYIRAHPPRRAADGSVEWEWLASTALLVLLAALITSKVLSPQYLIWTVPFMPFVARAQRGAVWTTFAVAGLVTYYIFPMHYTQLVSGEPGAELALLLRNLLLVALTLMAAASVRASASRAVRA